MSGICTDNDEEEHEVIAVPPKKRKLGLTQMDSLESVPTMEQEPAYSSVILTMMNILRQEGVLCDAHLQANQTKSSFPAHKLVLASASVCLKELFIKSPQTNLVISVDASDSAIQALLGFIYSGQLDTTQEIVIEELHAISKAWQLRALNQQCEEFLVALTRHRQMIAAASESSLNSDLTMNSDPVLADIEHQRKNGLDLEDAEEEKGVRNGRGDLMLGSAAKSPHRDDTRSQGQSTISRHGNKSSQQIVNQDASKAIGSIHMVSEDRPLTADERPLVGDEHQLGMKSEPEEEDESYGKMPGGLVVAEEGDNLDDMMLWKVKEEREEVGLGASDPQTLDPILGSGSPIVYGSGSLVSEPATDLTPGGSQPLSLMDTTSHNISPSGIFYKCFMCKLLFTDMQSCGAHVVSSHNMGKNTTIPIETVIPTHPEDAPKYLMSSRDKSGSRDERIANGEMTLYQCTECNKHFWSLARCRTHILNKHGMEESADQVIRTPIMIGGAGIGMVTSGNLLSDSTDEVPEWAKDPYHCYICKKTFPDAQAGRAHSLRHHCHPQRKETLDTEDVMQIEMTSVEPVVGKTASKSTRGKKKMTRAESTMQAIDPKIPDDIYPFPNHPYQCNFCKNVFEGLDECQQHIHEEHDISPDQVYVCYTRRKNRYKKQMKLGGRAEKMATRPSTSASVYDISDQSSSPLLQSSSSPSTSTTVDSFKCGFSDCARESGNLLDLAYHRYLDHEVPLPPWVTSYQCPVCGRMCRTKAALSTHLNSMHRPDSLTQTNLHELSIMIPGAALLASSHSPGGQSLS